MKSKLGTWSTGGKSADQGGKPIPKQQKVGKVMREFKSGTLKSSSGQKVTNPKQAMAIGLSKAGISKPKGSAMKTKKYMVGGPVGGEVNVTSTRQMPPTSNKGGAMRGLARAAARSGRNFDKFKREKPLSTTSKASVAEPSKSTQSVSTAPTATNASTAPAVAKSTAPSMYSSPTLRQGYEAAMGRGFAKGGGIETKGKTKGTMVKMARGGGIEIKGKTKGKIC